MHTGRIGRTATALLARQPPCQSLLTLCPWRTAALSTTSPPAPSTQPQSKKSQPAATYEDVLVNHDPNAPIAELTNNAFKKWADDMRGTSTTSIYRDRIMAPEILSNSPASPASPDAQSSEQKHPNIWPHHQPAKKTKTPLQQYEDDVKNIDVNLRIGPKTGRQFTVSPSKSGDLAVKLRLLAVLVTRGKLHRTRAQKFHERAGLKRKRLRRERWRVRFKTAFSQICERATHLAKQGW